jgi:cyclohexyl-isocyanide hydratase
MNRRQFASAVSVGLAATATAANVTASLGQAPVQRPAPIAPDKRLQVAALVYPGMILLDLVGPQTVFNLLRSDVHLVGKTRAPVRTDIGVAIGPTLAIDECPADLDLLFVPGGLEGSVAMMDEKEVLDVLADRGSRARFVTSVCTGALILGAAGLLRGYEATSHWYVRDLLALMGAKVATERVMVDRNRITGAGVTAGLDFGLELARRMRGEDAARLIQLVLEYDPKPPLDAGSPEKAGAELTSRVRQIRGPAITAAKQAAERAAVRLRI